MFSSDSISSSEDRCDEFYDLCRKSTPSTDASGESLGNIYEKTDYMKRAPNGKKRGTSVRLKKVPWERQEIEKTDKSKNDVPQVKQKTSIIRRSLKFHTSNGKSCNRSEESECNISRGKRTSNTNQGTFANCSLNERQNSSSSIKLDFDDEYDNNLIADDKKNQNEAAAKLVKDPYISFSKQKSPKTSLLKRALLRRSSKQNEQKQSPGHEKQRKSSGNSPKQSVIASPRLEDEKSKDKKDCSTSRRSSKGASINSPRRASKATKVANKLSPVVNRSVSDHDSTRKTLLLNNMQRSVNKEDVQDHTPGIELMPPTPTISPLTRRTDRMTSSLSPRMPSNNRIDYSNSDVSSVASSSTSMSRSSDGSPCLYSTPRSRANLLPPISRRGSCSQSSGSGSASCEKLSHSGSLLSGFFDDASSSQSLVNSDESCHGWATRSLGSRTCPSRWSVDPQLCNSPERLRAELGQDDTVFSLPSANVATERVRSNTFSGAAGRRPTYFSHRSRRKNIQSWIQAGLESSPIDPVDDLANDIKEECNVGSSFNDQKIRKSGMLRGGREESFFPNTLSLKKTAAPLHLKGKDSVANRETTRGYQCSPPKLQHKSLTRHSEIKQSWLDSTVAGSLGQRRISSSLTPSPVLPPIASKERDANDDERREECRNSANK